MFAKEIVFPSWFSADTYQYTNVPYLYFWWFPRDSLRVTPQASLTIRHNIEIFHVILSNLIFS